MEQEYKIERQLKIKQKRRDIVTIMSCNISCKKNKRNRQRNRVVCRLSVKCIDRHGKNKILKLERIVYRNIISLIPCKYFEENS